MGRKTQQKSVTKEPTFTAKRVVTKHTVSSLLKVDRILCISIICLNVFCCTNFLHTKQLLQGQTDFSGPKTYIETWKMPQLVAEL